MKKNTQRTYSPGSHSSRSRTESKEVSLHVVLDNVRSAYNVGSFFRTVDGAGSGKLHICGISAHPPNPKLEKTALGALDSVPWEYHQNTLDAVIKLKKLDIPVFAVENAPGSKDYRHIYYPDPVAIVLGHELHGVNDLILDKVDEIIHIPMRGRKSSLNVATAAGIIVYEATRSLP